MSQAYLRRQLLLPEASIFYVFWQWRQVDNLRGSTASEIWAGNRPKWAGSTLEVGNSINFHGRCRLTQLFSLPCS